MLVGGDGAVEAPPPPFVVAVAAAATALGAWVADPPGAAGAAAVDDVADCWATNVEFKRGLRVEVPADDKGLTRIRK